jgi:hypothetical protein
MRARRILLLVLLAALVTGGPAWADEAIRGTADPVTAPYVRADGRPQVDVIPPAGTRYYAVPVGRGEQVAARATLRPAGEVPGGACPASLGLEVVPPALSPVAGRGWVSFDGSTAATAVVAAPPAGEPGTWWLRVTTEPGRCAGGRPLPPGPYPLELAVSTTGGAPAPAVRADAPLPGGSSPALAPLLPRDGAPVLAELAPGESRWWRADGGDGGALRAVVVLGGTSSTTTTCPADVLARLLDGPAVVAVESAGFDGGRPAATVPAAGPGTGRDRYLQVSLTHEQCATGQAIPDRPYPLRIVTERAAGRPPVPAPVRWLAADPARGAWALVGTAAAVTALGVLVSAAVRLLGAPPSPSEKQPAAPRPGRTPRRRRETVSTPDPLELHLADLFGDPEDPEPPPATPVAVVPPDDGLYHRAAR